MMSHKERDAMILEVFKEMFKSYDVNDDGTIKTSELGEILRSLVTWQIDRKGVP